MFWTTRIDFPSFYVGKSNGMLENAGMLLKMKTVDQIDLLNIMRWARFVLSMGFPIAM